MTAILVAFFGVVVAVNFTMARYAVGTFGGTVVDNSYVASQEFNTWLRQAHRQAKLGWTPEFVLTADRHISIVASASGHALLDATLAGTLRHPLGQAPDQEILFDALGRGRWISLSAVPKGRWIIHLTLTQVDKRFAWVESVG